MSSTAERLHVTVAAVCPLVGVSIGILADKATWRLDFDPAATPAQKTAAQAAVTAFDVSDAAQAAWEDAQRPERTALRSAAAQAVIDLNTYLALPSPTNAQMVAVVNKLCVDMRAVIKRLVQLD